jgi:ubiquinone/menaquinone biosynthesis C-methylase UbiE
VIINVAEQRAEAAGGFDRLAGSYRALELLAFGRDLERTRFALLPALADRKSILVLGEGDGRCLVRLLALAPRARVHCVDSSPGMLARAQARVGEEDLSRVQWECADAREVPLAPARYDAVVTLFFLDCFSGEDVRRLVARVGSALQPRACWLFADFVLPEAGWRRWRARAWLGLLYFFFRWQARLGARALPPSEAILAEAGWQRECQVEFQAGLLRTVLWWSATSGRAPARFGAAESND